MHETTNADLTRRGFEAWNGRDFDPDLDRARIAFERYTSAGWGGFSPTGGDNAPRR